LVAKEREREREKEVKNEENLLRRNFNQEKKISK